MTLTTQVFSLKSLFCGNIWILTLQIPFGLQALHTGTCWTQESCAVQSQGRTDALAAPALGHISTIPLSASRRARSPGGSQYPTTLCSGSESPGTGRRPSGSPQWPPTRLASPYPPAWPPLTFLPGPFILRGAQGSGTCAPARLPRWAGRAPAHASGTSPGAGPGSPELPRCTAAGTAVLEALQENSAGEGGRSGFPELSRPPGSYPCPCPVELIFCPVREYVVMGKTAPRK